MAEINLELGAPVPDWSLDPQTQYLEQDGNLVMVGADGDRATVKDYYQQDDPPPLFTQAGVPMPAETVSQRSEETRFQQQQHCVEQRPAFRYGLPADQNSGQHQNGRQTVEPKA